MVADILRKDNRNDMVTNGYGFVAVFHILGAKETEGNFHAVLSLFAPFLQTKGCKYTRVLGMKSLTR